MEFKKAIIVFLAFLSDRVLSNSVGISQSYVERSRKIAGNIKISVDKKDLLKSFNCNRRNTARKE